ncbi:S41 family peptidase [Enterococcus caccae]|uniref:C-terminal processing peptidase n=1 Tax=Enterococcus caccae ATCC BAA-1240 TaxID=1158612 RepID=R3W940_9ENTE|nr:S41 family peptidase [Enterococcus caccae]EOL44386.1 C-terminal processing peptidase [Enterococcus caccae ATCC BAA-1240]EOT68498.1 carboxyl-terminal protease [Enterococcus caccae ATCC BAA-1240]OJG28289.1 C-terminal processing peptidase [Enterococcus caccae]
MKNTQQVPFHQYIISIVCVAFLVGGGSYIYFDHQYKKQLANNPAQSGDLRKVDNLYNEIVTNYVGKIDEKKLIDGALKGMTEALDDPYSSYLNEPEADELDQSLAGSFEGIGATMTMTNELPSVAQAPIEGSPAAKAGMKTGDTILKVDEEETEGKTLSQVVSKIRGKKGTEVRLTIARGDETFELKLTRDTIPIETVKGELDKSDSTIGSIKIISFGENTYNELKKTIKTLRKAGAKSFVIDLRQNPGGLLDQVEQMASMFLEDGKTIIKFEDKNGNTSEDTASSNLDGGFKVTEPTVVLVDEGSASASEIFAAALKESGNKKIIGTKTFGKGTVQTVKNLSDKSEIKLTVLKWLTPNGKWIHEKGLEPSIKADYPDYAYLSPISRDKTFKQGDSSPVVKNINALLHALDYEVDGNSSDFSEQTKTAVSALQTGSNLPITGEVDNDTATQIESEVGKKIKENDQAYDVALKELQKK